MNVFGFQIKGQYNINVVFIKGFVLDILTSHPVFLYLLLYMLAHREEEIKCKEQLKVR